MILTKFHKKLEKFDGIIINELLQNKTIKLNIRVLLHKSH